MNPATTLQARQKASNTVNASATAEGLEDVGFFQFGTIVRVYFYRVSDW
jgi:hypothetical protein